MANDAITLNGGAGSQTSTDSPQAGAGASNVGAQTRSNLQSSAASNLQGGQQLSTNSLSTIKLNGQNEDATQTKTSTKAVVPLQTHHIDVTLLILPAILLLLAVASVWFVRQSAKSTTDYS